MPFYPLPHAGRSQVFSALFNLLKTVPAPQGYSWKMQTQDLVSWNNVDATSQPALFLHRGPQLSEQKQAFGVTKLHWRATAWVYYRTDGLHGNGTYPDTFADAILDNFEQTFQTDPMNGRLTLGGLVWHCWLDGMVTWDPGLLDNQGVLVVPISILL